METVSKWGSEGTDAARSRILRPGFPAVSVEASFDFDIALCYTRFENLLW